MSHISKFLLTDKQIPPAWVNILPHIKEPMDMPVHPGTLQPLGPADLAPIFPMSLIQQEFSPQPEIDVPGEVLDIYRLWRPTPLYRARRLEQALDTPAHIYYNFFSRCSGRLLNGSGGGADSPYAPFVGVGGGCGVDVEVR